MPGPPVEVRAGGPADLSAVVAMLDGAVAWLVERGRAGQWGARPISERPERATSYVRDHMVWIAEEGGVPVGTMILSAGAPAHVPAEGGPQLYVVLLVVDRRYAGRGIGRVLLGVADGEARRLGLPVVRVDCFAGVDERLVEYYRGCGFEEEGRFRVGEWVGCVLGRRVVAG